MAGPKPTSVATASSADRDDDDDDKNKNNKNQNHEKPEIRRRRYQTARQDLIDILAKRIVKKVNEKAEQPLKDFRANLPQDSQSIRELPFYETTLKTLQWQRDNYLVGPFYANRNRQKKSLLYSRMPLDATCLGHLQIVHLGSWFVPSATIKEALLPIVVALPLGSLYEPIIHTVTNAIPLAQPLLDEAVKSSVIDFLKNPEWRQVIKTQAQGYIAAPIDGNDRNDTAPSSTPPTPTQQPDDNVGEDDAATTTMTDHENAGTGYI